MVQEKTQEIGAMEQERDSLLNAISMVSYVARKVGSIPTHCYKHTMTPESTQ